MSVLVSLYVAIATCIQKAITFFSALIIGGLTFS